jgi:ABC-type bacteriocin/lantibiotic exporter with double-glycine peptidase domain
VIARRATTGSPVRLRALTRTASRAPSALALVLIAGTLATIPGLAVPMLVRVFLNQYLVDGDAAWVGPILLGLLAAAALAGLLVWLQWRVLSMVAVRLSATDSSHLVWHLLRLPVPAVDEMGVGDLTARAAGLQRLAFQAGMLLPLALVNVISLVVYGTALVLLDARIGLTAIIVVVASMLTSIVLLRRRRSLQQRSDDTRLALTSATSETITAIETVKATSSEQWVFDRLSRTAEEATEAVSDLGSDGQRLGMVTPVTQTVGLGVVLALGTVLVFQGQLDLGTLVAAEGLLVALLVPASQLVWLGALLEFVASAQRLADEPTGAPLDVEVAERRADAQRMVPTTPVGLRLVDVVFGYASDQPPLFDGLSVEVPAGQWVAVVGSSGSGKSTLARLVVGELQPSSGTVEIDGTPRLQLPRRWCADTVGYVPQYPVLLPGTIEQNITLFDESIPTETVAAALALCCVDSAVASRPGGLLELVSDTGHGFSGGELQRLAIARAIVRNPRLLVLDEATSALDPLVEADIEDHLRRVGCTCLIVAHRLSTVRDADHIVVLEEGRIVQSGPFDALRRTGRFAELLHG